MANIDVERTGHNVWPWVIGVLALILLVVALTSLLSGGDGTVQVRQATPETAPATGR